MSDSIASLISRAAAMQRDGRRVVACLLVRARGSTPQQPGALMLVDDAAHIHGTIGGGCVEAEVRQRAHQMLHDDQSGLLSFKLDHDYGWDDGLICGGTIELAVGQPPAFDELESILHAIERRQPASFKVTVRTDQGSQAYVLDLPPRDRLYIAGAGHVGRDLAQLAQELDYEVTMFDDRDDLLAKLAPTGVRTVAGDIAQSLRAAAFDESTYCAIITRGHKHDEEALHAVIDKDAAYIGMIGSRRKVKLVFDDLRAMGVDDERLQRVHAPIGLDISAVTVREIALSIAAQLVQVRRSLHPQVVRGPLAAEPTAVAGRA